LSAKPEFRKVANLEAQIEMLNNRLQSDTSTAVALLQLQHPQQNTISPIGYSQDDRTSSVNMNSNLISGTPENVRYMYPPSRQENVPLSPAKRKRGDFEITNDGHLDVVGKGLLSYNGAMSYFRTFFEGCVSYTSDF
jgi:hypothetical protein